MATPNSIASEILERLHQGQDADFLQRLSPRLPGEHPLPPRPPQGNDLGPEAVAARLEMLRNQDIPADGFDAPVSTEALAGNIENLVGFMHIPLGLAGPLRVNGLHAFGDYYVPLATTEGALVASVSRGAYVVSHSGGCAAACLTESVSRAPCFVFNSMVEAGAFLAWLLPRVDRLQETVAQTSSHCRLQDMRTSVLGREVYLIFEYRTGDAAGQNMVTLATDAICRRLVAESPVAPRKWYVEANLSGDKKATMMSFLYARGRKVVVEAVLDQKLVKRFLHVSPEEMFQYWQVSVLGGSQSGSIGVQGHYSNTLAALFIACGQDAACVAEASVGITRMDLTPSGDLYVSVSVPSLIVGTVGGGTGLPGPRQCLETLRCFGDGGATRFAEICGATILAGEVSIIASLAAGDFAQAHSAYGRKK